MRISQNRQYGIKTDRPRLRVQTSADTDGKSCLLKSPPALSTKDWLEYAHSQHQVGHQQHTTPKAGGKIVSELTTDRIIVVGALLPGQRPQKLPHPEFNLETLERSRTEHRESQVDSALIEGRGCLSSLYGHTRGYSSAPWAAHVDPSKQEVPAQTFVQSGVLKKQSRLTEA